MRYVMITLCAAGIGCGGGPFTLAESQVSDSGAALETATDPGAMADEVALDAGTDLLVDAGPDAAHMRDAVTGQQWPHDGGPEKDAAIEAMADAKEEPAPSQFDLCAMSCQGCCTGSGLCLSGDTFAACGTGGYLCAPCHTSQTCNAGACI